MARPDGTEVIAGEREGNIETAAEVGLALAEELLSRGAERILERL